MSLSDLASLGSFVSGLAVLATLVFLLLQTRQNTLALQRAEANATQAQISAWRIPIINSREVAKLLTSAGSEGVDDVDLLRFNFLMSEIVWSFVHVWSRDRAGLLPMGGWMPVGGLLAQRLSTGRGPTWWEQNKSTVPPAFRVDVDNLLASMRSGSS